MRESLYASRQCMEGDPTAVIKDEWQFEPFIIWTFNMVNKISSFWFPKWCYTITITT